MVFYGLKYEKVSEQEVDYGIQAILQMKEGPITQIKKIGLQQVFHEFESLAKSYGQRFQIEDLAQVLMNLNKDIL